MKKGFLFLVVVVAAILLTGCVNQKNQGNNSQNITANANSQNGQGRRPDFGQPDRPADIIGLVKSITGNEVNVIKLDRPNRASGTPENSNGNSDNSNSSQNGERTNRINTPMMFGNGGGQRLVSGRGEGAGGPQGQENSDSRAAMLEELKKMSTGDETITIPVGIRMLKPDTIGTGKQPQILEANLSDITADKMIQVWLDASVQDRKIAEFVLIMR